MNSLRSKIAIFLLAPIIVLTIGYFLVSELVLKRDFIKHLEDESRDKASTMSHRFKDNFLSGNKTGLIQQVFDEKYSDKEIRYIVIYNNDSKVIAESLLGNDSIGPSLDAGLHDESEYYMPVASAANHNFDESIYNVEIPISAGLYKLGMVRVGFDFSSARSGYLVSLYLSLGLGLLSFVLVIFLARKLSSVIVKPVDDLMLTMSDYAKGDFSSFAKVTSLDEIGDLAVTFNLMKSKLEENQKKLIQEKKRVEAKASQLEAWQKTAVARELKMIELKNRVKELEESSNNDKS